VKFLIDHALSPRIARTLREAGHDAVHAIECGMEESRDWEYLERAQSEHRVLITSDTDFGDLLAFSRANKPSVILLRRMPFKPALQIEILLRSLPAIGKAVEKACIVVLEEDRIRVRLLPI
jgi:predicted nuclease of predicted toxin-antitoxin system